MSSKSTYKRLGDYIREVDVRNRDLAVTNLLGVSVSKEFIPSIANTIGTDMSTYKIVSKGQFVYIADTSRRGDKIAIALLEKDENAIVSSIYTTFEVNNDNELLPAYLIMWFRRPEFDRYARFHSHGSAREIFDWNEMCDVMMPIPSIVCQREIVAEYETLSRRIAINEQMIASLEETAQTLYRKMFVDGIDKENLPEGWRIVNIFEVSDIVYGFPFNSDLFTNNITKTPIVRIRDISSNQTNTYTSECVNEKYKILINDILIGMDGNFYISEWSGEIAYLNQRVVRIRVNDNSFISSKQIIYSISQPIKELESSIEGTTVAHLSDKDLKQLHIILADNKTQTNVSVSLNKLSKLICHTKLEINKLTKLQSLLLAKMGQ